jgi:hypothetical protein
MTVIVKHNKTNTITDWTQAQLNEQIALGNFPPGTTLANIVLPSDWNNDHTLTGLGTMAEQNANSVAITGGTINNTTIGATTATTGKFTSVTTPSVTATTNDLTLSAISTGAVNLATAGGTQFQIANTASTTNYLATTGSNGGTPALYSAGASTNIGTNIVSKGTGSVAFYTNGGVVQQVVSHTASAVNYVQITGGATGNSPVISAQGSDAAVALSFTSKSTNAIRFLSNNAANLQFRIVGTNTAVNNLAVTGTIATNAPSLSSEGSDTNISMAFQPKGTGAIDLAAGSSGVNISNGGTVTAITRTNAGTNYTSFPTVVISAPTTAGGVQATTSFLLASTGSTIVSGGTGYTVGNTLTVVGGTGGPTTLTVSTVSSGVITGVTALSNPGYSVLPANPVSVTGGSGSGATFNIIYGIANGSFTITNAGSGYIEQPTVTFSGGGGSGAAAYATVGSSTVVRSLGTTMDFYTPNQQIGFQVRDLPAGTSVGYWQSFGGTTSPIFRAIGTTSAQIQTSSNVPIQFVTGAATAQNEQFRVSHTASAVNYVQVTGGTTGAPGQVQISAQGSDANVNMILQSRGTGFVSLLDGNALTGLRVGPRATNGDTFIEVQRAVGFVDLIAASGVADGDIRLTPKGTGNVRFGTRTASADVAITGYIEIKDAGGTVRRLAVVG